MNRDVLDAPIVCAYAEDGTVRVFGLVTEAQSAVEAIDIGPDDVAFDRHGRLLEFVVEGLDWRPGRVHLRAKEDEPTHRSDLEAHLRRYLRSLVDHARAPIEPGWVESATIEQMLARGLEFEAEKKRRARRNAVGCLIVLAAAVGLIVWRFVF